MAKKLKAGSSRLKEKEGSQYRAKEIKNREVRIQEPGEKLLKPATQKVGRAVSKMAEREGFEPSKELSPFTRLAGERLQPARPSLLELSFRQDQQD